MAYYRIEYFSKALCRQTSFEMLIPNDQREVKEEKPMTTLFLLHGYTGKAGNWVPEGLPEKYNFAIVMPTTENGFYLDGLSTGHAYQTLVGVELVNYVRKTFNLARTPKDTLYRPGVSRNLRQSSGAVLRPDRARHRPHEARRGQRRGELRLLP